jgi:hypothetical protein
MSAGSIQADYPMLRNSRPTPVRSMTQSGVRVTTLGKSLVTRAPVWRISDTRVRDCIAFYPLLSSGLANPWGATLTPTKRSGLNEQILTLNLRPP